MAIVEAINVEATEGAVRAAASLPMGLTPFNGLLLLIVALLAVRAFVQPRPFVAEGAKQPAQPPLPRLNDTMTLLADPQPPAEAPAKPTASGTTRLLQGAFTALLDEVFVFSPNDFSVSFMNAKAQKRVADLGLSKDKVRFPDILPATNRQIIVEAARNLMRSSLDSIVFELNAADAPCELTMKLIREDKDKVYFMAILRDISGRVNEARAQSDYVATLSHEMRTPLTSIKGAVELIASGKMGELSGGAAATLGVAQRNVDRLLRLTNDILDLQKMDAGQMRCDFEPVSLSSLVRDGAQDIQGYARQFDVSIRVTAELADGGMVLADRTRLMQVLANLLSNAIKHSAPRDEVVILARDMDRHIRVAVVDHGPGIPEKLRNSLFEPYQQGPQVQRKVASTGLGLSIAKRIVEAHSGSIGFDSEAGDGAVFYFDIPKLGSLDEVAA